MDRVRVRAAANWITLATPLGLLLARATGCPVRRGPRLLHYAHGYRPRLPNGAAFCIGNVILVRDERLLGNHRLMGHEEHHAGQWAWCLGLLGFPVLYGLAMLWSYALAGDHFSRNTFERRAGLAAGGYADRS